MLKNIIEKIKIYSVATDLNHQSFGIVPDPKGNLIKSEEILPDLKKEAELQEEMIIKCIKVFSSKTGKMDEFIKIKGEAIEVIEKYYNKKWENIIR
jgi:hypothetical protein